MKTRTLLIKTSETVMQDQDEWFKSLCNISKATDDAGIECSRSGEFGTRLEVMGEALLVRVFKLTCFIWTDSLNYCHCTDIMLESHSCFGLPIFCELESSKDHFVSQEFWKPILWSLPMTNSPLSGLLCWLVWSCVYSRCRNNTGFSSPPIFLIFSLVRQSRKYISISM